MELANGGAAGRGRWRLGNVPVDRVGFAEALDAIARLVEAGNGGAVFTPNVDHVVLAETDARLRAAYDRVSLSLGDGMPVVWASRLFGPRLPGKVSGSDLVLPLMKLAAARGWRVYVVGGAEGVAARAAKELRERIPRLHVVGTDSPRIDMDAPSSGRADVSVQIREARPDLVLVAFGSPKQELWIDEVRDALRPSVLVAVGAGLDFVAGVVRRAPGWMSAAGLEWLYRLAREPRRLWRRYLVRDPRFVLIVWRMLRETRGGLLSGLGRVLRYGAERLVGPFFLRHCDRVGVRARTRGRPVIENQGRIELGDRILINSSFAPVRLAAASGAVLQVGREALINFGVSISAEESVTIGSRVRLGPYVTIADHDDQLAGSGRSGDPRPRPVTIGDDVWLAARVRVGKGAVIGAGAVVTAGSHVTGEIPAGALAGGVPARVLERPKDAEAIAAAPRPSAPPPVDCRGLLLADFTIQELADHLRRGDGLGPEVEATVAPFDQVVPALHGLRDGANPGLDFAVVWTRPESMRTFRARLLNEPVATEDILAEVDAFAELVKEAASGVRSVFVPSWVLPAYERGLGMLDMGKDGLTSTLARMNLRLAEALEGSAGVHLLGAQRWIQRAGPTAMSVKSWHIGKVGLSPAVFAEAARDIRAALRGLRGQARKLIVLDLDDTLWGGIVGEIGWPELKLGGHDAEGESFAEFQRRLKALTRRGVLLAIASKNDEAVALEAIDRHPEMILKAEDFSARRINWEDKAQNIVEIARELNLGLGSVVFIDDNPVERSRVRAALPEVYVPDWPRDKLLYASALLELRCLDVPHLGEEDRTRVALYAAERQRKQALTGSASHEEWLESLGTRVRFSTLDAVNLPRAVELLNKTNQFNLRTRRLTAGELRAWAGTPGREMWVVQVSDRFGDAGLVGIVGLEWGEAAATLVDCVLSCRVMGRQVEEAMVWAAIHRAREGGARRLVAPFFPTGKNKPCFDFFMKSGLERGEDGGGFFWEAGQEYPRPRAVSIEGTGLEVERAVHHA
jgi:exopolysaccharide biosynthesis WecB/TagA/CpsF family protein